ncbi:FAD-binding monooxygenase [Isoptericola variabilis]|uniref:Phenol hydroxylase domain protein dimerization n=1 Tax=Isoptericola variabilis (strain 225) TaxID=743718 RepID=F6FXE0_ISOV2|nr:FAD-binding monooxygenase [Isoptericola variabilis]AEG44668.1 Phenol hydroxylase domain protein dimerization [Isoptericola variabilis 225]TWH33474.1 phenol 2-monooxygenase [Isoptericola variabilis J7]
MQFHHHGYVTHDPRIQPAAGVGIDRPAELPDEVDVLIVGSGPAGMIAAAQLAQFPDITTRVVERRPGRLEMGQADGIQSRSVETFQAFGFAERITAEAYRIVETCFWKPDPDEPRNIVRTARPADDPTGISEFPHLIVNQARVLDYFAEVAASSPTRLTPDYGLEAVGVEIAESGDHPVTVTLRHTAGPRAGEERTVRARYVIGCDGAHSTVRQAIGCHPVGDKANHAWGVMDVLAVTDFPDVRTKCVIQSHDGGSILLIPREGGFLARWYVDLGVVPPDDGGAIRRTPLSEIIERANQIIHPYTLDVRDVPWHSVYEVGHRVTDRFDDVPVELAGTRTPRVFITGDACHTHSAKAGQGMNVSMQDGWNIAWKLAHVLTGRAPESLLATYSAERQVVAQNLIDFDRQWSSLMAAKPDELEDPSILEDFYVRSTEFYFGFMTQYAPSMIVGEATHQDLATGFPVGKRFKSAPVERVADGNPVHLGHHARADGRWRVYAFADAAPAGEDSALAAWAEWLGTSPESPLLRHTPEGADPDSVLDVKVVYQQDHTGVDIGKVPPVFLPRVGPFGLVDYEKVYATDPHADIFDLRGIDRASGAVVVVRPDQYVAHVLPLTATDELTAFFAQNHLPASAAQAARQPVKELA